MSINEAGLDIIRDSEGLRLKAYRDPIGILTIGYGHTGADVKYDSVITHEIAERLLLQDLKYAEGIVTKHVKPMLNENQFSALVSFVFNVGAGCAGVKSGFVTLRNGLTSTMLKLINASKFDEAAEEFPKWAKAGGIELPGLVKRRNREMQLFLTPIDEA
jgi:lysozyme